MEDASIVEPHLAKRDFQVYGVGIDGRVVCRKNLFRGQLPTFCAQLPPCVVAMEACATAHFWACEVSALARCDHHSLIDKPGP